MAQPPTKSGKTARPPQRGTMRDRRSFRATAESALARVILKPTVGWGLLIAIVCTLVIGMSAAWTREQPLVSAGRVMNQTRLARLTFTLEDRQATERAIESARQNTPRRFAANQTALTDLREGLLRLPAAMSGVDQLDDVSPNLREQFAITDSERFDAIRSFSGPENTDRWSQRVGSLMDMLARRPLLSADSWQRVTQDGLASRLVLVNGNVEQTIDRVDMPLSIDDLAQKSRELGTIIRIAGFAPRDGPLGPVGEVVFARLLNQQDPTYVFDNADSLRAQDEAASLVSPTQTLVTEGQPIFRRGDVLTPAQLLLLRAEMQTFLEDAPWWRVWLRRLSIFGAIGSVVIIIGGYITLFGDRISRRVARMAWLAVLFTTAIIIACVTTVIDPRFMALTTTAPTLLVAVLLVIAYDRRRAVALGALHALAVCIALDQPIGQMAVLFFGAGTAVWQLRDVRHRRRIVHMSMIAGLALAVGTLGISLLDRPLSAVSLRQMLVDSAWSAFAGPLVGGITLFILPTIERIFDITTGMTLTELRDPRHPLLRMLQQRAPGTYSHSLNVASIAESAADAIGADSLLTYVGCLYHDIGKASKPEYFVENQAGGHNKHDRLNPAMSLLVIIGHVKDGLAMAREYHLPKQLEAFIAEHHGTTLVEYFYKLAAAKAREQEKADEAEEHDKPEPPTVTLPGAARRPTENPTLEDTAKQTAKQTPKPDSPTEARAPDMVDYRYPGPKPQRKETAIIMLADCSESAVRAMPEPTASRIDTLVRELARKRLLDGQFDDCNLTLVELGKVTESIIKTLTSIYHSRISYDVDKDAAKHKAATKERRA